MAKKTTIGERLRQARLDAGLTQWQLAVNAKTQPGHVSALENGRWLPGLDLLVRLSRALGVSVGWLIGEEG